MEHDQFKERLEEIQDQLAEEVVAEYDWRETHIQKSTESLITLFEDYTKAIVGEDEFGGFNELLSARQAEERNELRQTINQTSKTILRGSE